MIVKPQFVLDRGIISGMGSEEQIQQVGIDLRINTPAIVSSQSFQNLDFMETFNMQNHVGLLFVRSSLSRKGVFVTSGLYDPGFNGQGGCSLYNMGDTLLTLPAGFCVCQMVVVDPTFQAELYDGHYNKNKTIESKLEK